MPIINLKQDALLFRKFLDEKVDELSAKTISAIEVGYDGDQGGWIFIHGDSRKEHERDGEWTAEVGEDNTLDMSHWIEAIEERFEGQSVSLTKIDDTTIELPPIDLDADEDEDDDSDDPLPAAIGEMIQKVLLGAKEDGLFKHLTSKREVQLDIEDFNGAWGWPTYEELGKINLA